MRKSKNYYKFMEYMAFGIGGWHDDAILVDNGVIECVAHAKVEFIEDYSKLYKCNYFKMSMDSDTWLTFKYVLVNEEVINVYYVTDECERFIEQFILDDYRTQKEVANAIHKKVVCFFLNRLEFCEFHATEETEKPTETAQHDEIDTYQPYIYIDTDNIKYLMETHSFPSTPTHEPTCKKVHTSSIYGMFGQFPTVPDMYNNKCFCCPADRQGNRCGGEKWCKETWKRYEVIIKPEWHHVSLATLANIDFGMLDEKRQTYLTAFRDLQKTLSYLRKCKTQDTYDTCFIRYIKRKNMLWAEGKISNAMRKFIEAKLSMQNVESGVWASKCEEAAGYHESRRYNKSRVGK